MDFDRIIDRAGTGAVKWRPRRTGGGAVRTSLIPLWVADMDFAPPEAVTAALRARLEHPILGYTDVDPAYLDALSAWYGRRYGVRAEPEDFLLGPGVVPSLAIATRTFADPGEGVLILPPVYGPFAEVVRDNGRVVVEAPLAMDASGRLGFDPAAAGRAIDAAALGGRRTRLLLLCSPHNPGGVVWRRDELAGILAFAANRDLVVVSDEVHGDLVHTPGAFASLAGFPGAAGRAVALSAPNKTFNLAGLHLSHFVVADPGLKARLRIGLAGAGFSQPNVLSQTAALAAYRDGGPWLDALLAYLRANLEFAVGFIGARIPGLSAAFPEGTYLIWADASGLIAAKGLASDKALTARLETDTGVKLTAGSAFGTGGAGRVRINAACPRALLAEGLERLAAWAAAPA